MDKVELKESQRKALPPLPSVEIVVSTDYAVRGTVASQLVRSTPDMVVRVQALAGVIVLCS